MPALRIQDTVDAQAHAIRRKKTLAEDSPLVNFLRVAAGLHAKDGMVGVLRDSAADAREDVNGAMRYGANKLSNNPDTEKPNTYVARRHLKGDGAFEGVR